MPDEGRVIDRAIGFDSDVEFRVYAYSNANDFDGQGLALLGAFCWEGDCRGWVVVLFLLAFDIALLLVWWERSPPCSAVFGAL